MAHTSTELPTPPPTEPTPRPQPLPTDPTPPQPTDPTTATPSAAASASTLPPPNPFPPSLLPSSNPNPRLPSHLQCSSPSLPAQVPSFSSSASPSPSSSLQPPHPSSPPLQPAHLSSPPLQPVTPSPPPLQPASLSSPNLPSSGQKFGGLSSQGGSCLPSSEPLALAFPNEIKPAHLSSPPLQPAHLSSPPLQPVSPSPPTLQPASLSSPNLPSSWQKFGGLASQVFSSTFKFLTKMRIDLVCAVVNIIAQGISNTFDEMGESNVEYCTFLGLAFGFVAVIFSIGELYWLKMKKLPIGFPPYMELIMGLMQFIFSVLTFLHFEWMRLFPLVLFKFSTSLGLALFVGYHKVTKKPTQCQLSEMDTDSIILIHVDSLISAPPEIGEWISENRLEFR